MTVESHLPKSTCWNYKCTNWWQEIRTRVMAHGGWIPQSRLLAVLNLLVTHWYNDWSWRGEAPILVLGSTKAPHKHMTHLLLRQTEITSLCHPLEKNYKTATAKMEMLKSATSQKKSTLTLVLLVWTPLNCVYRTRLLGKNACETHNTQEIKIEIVPNLAIQGTLRMQILAGP